MSDRSDHSGNWLVQKASALLESRTSRRGFLARTALAGSAVAVAPVRYLLRPVTAYAAVCGCAGYGCDCSSLCCDGYTEFCCVVNNGVNACPEGTFWGGWWRADGSVFCESGTRYIIDCNANCGVDFGCRCANGDCGQRRVACNWFRYGQCNGHVACAGPIVCRMVTCEAPYLRNDACTADTIWDNSTANHSANCPEVGAPEGGRAGGDENPPGRQPRERDLVGRERDRVGRPRDIEGRPRDQEEPPPEPAPEA